MLASVKTIGIIGTGMMASSLAAAIKEYSDIKPYVYGFDTPEVSSIAMQTGIIDAIAENIEWLWRQSQLIIFGCPVNATLSYIAKLPAPKDHQLVIDLSSVKKPIVDAALQHWQQGSSHFVACHPMAGKHRHGPQAYDAQLYNQAKIFITAHAFNTQQILQQVMQLWQDISAKPIHIDVQRHDELLAKVSHLPHLLAFALVDSLYRHNGKQVFDLAAGGFRDFTRIASSDAVMWRDICDSNQVFIDCALEQFIGDLRQLQMAIKNKDLQYIEDTFKRAKKARDDFYE